jgi:DNA-directed RNA polymerase II subunit RPB1
MNNDNGLIKKIPSRVIGIQFSILSPDEIRSGSVAEIVSRDTYVNGKPVIGGLFDPRMGVLEPGMTCPTDGLSYIESPGYFGHIELARPVFYIQYLNTILKILRCVCFKCSKLLIEKDEYKHIYNLDAEQKWKSVYSIISKLNTTKSKRCGEHNSDGCNYLQPKKISKKNLSSIVGEWAGDNTEQLILKFTPEIVLKIFKRISADDVSFMGFSPLWSRPDWMICQVLLVPPPCVRPSIKHDSQQRSEDDLSHILVNIIKYNKILQDKIKNNAPENIIDEWTSMLQYYIASQIDNNMPKVCSVAQRSGRCLKSIKDRLNGKQGRMRSNLMAKRVDFSARSVITADPNISIQELGIPIKIAKNITHPVYVNDMNKMFLTKLILNGPLVYPGANILNKKNGDSISLRHVDRSTLVLELENGDIVHRHMMDGDPILFNRQPTLHRMSMMCHKAKVMEIGDTFRMNVADTKPYNADFDGDEMNLHMPQDMESSSELMNLAAVKYQLISPANNAPIIGIYQDSMLGSFRFTRDNINFNKRDAMNLLFSNSKIDIKKLMGNKNKLDTISSFEILSQILPNISLQNKNNLFNDEYANDSVQNSNNVITINNGDYISGQIDKGILGGSSRGLIHRICNDFGNETASVFIDDLQNIITEYMKSSSYSVGISDLMSNKTTIESIIKYISVKKTEARDLIHQVQLGVLENNTGKSNNENFENKITNILNKAISESGKIGIRELNKNNRFVIMVKAGSKGSDLNISQMISCVGQQIVDSKRIPYGFEDRTLPHFTKYDDSPEARGFVENSYINGLTPQELFFHAMGGRVGLIDTAVKTSTTGYIQRRLVKSLEDLMVFYDMTVRSNKNKIIQFKYGDDCIDPIKVENQILPLVHISIDDIYAHYSHIKLNTGGTIKNKVYKSVMTSATYKRFTTQESDTLEKNKFYIDYMIQMRDSIIKNICKYKSESKVHAPVSFVNIINNIRGQQSINNHSTIDITPLEYYEMIENTYAILEHNEYIKPTELFKTLYYYYLSPNNILLKHRFNKLSTIYLLETIILRYKQAVIAPGEMVGIIAAQSIGEPTTQMTLNTFHFAGVSSKSNVSRGVPRIEEILTLSKEPKNPSLTIHLNKHDETEKNRVQSIMDMLEHTKIKDIINNINICFDPNNSSSCIDNDNILLEQYNEFLNMINECNENDTIIQNDKNDKNDKNKNKNNYSKWVLRISFDRSLMLDKNITMNDINFALNNNFQNEEIQCIFNDFNDGQLIFRIRMKSLVTSLKSDKTIMLDQSDDIYLMQLFKEKILQTTIKGVNNISKVIKRKIKNNIASKDGEYVKQDIWVIDTIGTNILHVLSLDYIDSTRSYSNNIHEMYSVFGIEAARQVIYNELIDVIEFDGTYINYHHLSILCDRMTYVTKMISVFRHGINNDNIGPMAKASFEETPEMFLKAARHAELDNMRGISANVACGQEGYYGTSCFQVVLNIEQMMELSVKNKQQQTDNEIIKMRENFDNIDLDTDPNDLCSKTNISMKNNVQYIKSMDIGEDDDYELEF